MLDDVDAADEGLAARRDDPGREHADRRRLSRTVGAEQPEDLTHAHLQVEPVDGPEVRARIGLGEADRLDDGRPVPEGRVERHGGGRRGHVSSAQYRPREGSRAAQSSARIW